MGAKFLCCLPLRFGVVIISFLQFALAALTAVALGYVLKEHEVSGNFKTSAIIYTVVYGLQAISSLLGFIGALTKKVQFIAAYARMIIGLFVVHLIAGVVFIILYFTRSKSSFLNRCIDGSTDQDTITNCNNFAKNNKAVVIASVAVPLVIELYGCYIVAAYVTKLEQKGARQTMAMQTQPYAAAQYDPVSLDNEDTKPLTQPDVIYPYADASNSFGHHASAQV